MSMQASVHIDAGVCGFHTHGRVISGDGQHVQFEIQSDCEKIQKLAERLGECGEIDAYQEISPVGQSEVLAAAREALPGCCAACAVPVGLFKAMQVAAGLALPKDIQITLTKE
jgi:Family of unknown function (DUF6951)